MIAECHSEYVSFRKKPPNCLPSCTFVTRDFVIVQIVQRCVPVSQTGGMARWGWGPESRLWETPGIRWVLSGNTVRSFPCLSPSQPWLWLHGSKGTPLGEGALAGGTVSASGSFGNCISVSFSSFNPHRQRGREGICFLLSSLALLSACAQPGNVSEDFWETPLICSHRRFQIPLFFRSWFPRTGSWEDRGGLLGLFQPNDCSSCEMLD